MSTFNGVIDPDVWNIDGKPTERYRLILNEYDGYVYIERDYHLCSRAFSDLNGKRGSKAQGGMYWYLRRIIPIIEAHDASAFIFSRKGGTVISVVSPFTKEYTLKIMMLHFAEKTQTYSLWDER